MLTRTKPSKRSNQRGRFVIVASEYNGPYVDAMVQAAREELVRAGVRRIRTVRVPGAFEIPAVAAKLAAARSNRPAVIICLGVIFRGETTHAQQIADAVSLALVELQIRHQLPVVHGVYLFENERQARVRCLGTRYNRGLEVAQTALAMARVMAEL